MNNEIRKEVKEAEEEYRKSKQEYLGKEVFVEKILLSKIVNYV